MMNGTLDGTVYSRISKHNAGLVECKNINSNTGGSKKS
jgi:hypothetical protein